MAKPDFKEIESKWQDWWVKENIHDQYDASDTTKPVYSIDSPPPYPSGDFHMGNILNYTYFDFLARYKRLRGFNVHYPQGWDVHGLPTEQKVEKAMRKKSSQVERSEWRKMCTDWTAGNIAKARTEMRAYGFATDWRYEYMTSDDNYMRTVQLSFIKAIEDKHAYRAQFPVNWCTSCQTAISDAEVEYEERPTNLIYLKFKYASDPKKFVEIATTRPELMASCLFIDVHPNDARYKDLVGKEIIVPLFNHKVKVVTDTNVDREFGSGAMQVCSYGDKDDANKILARKPKVIIAFTDDGFMTDAAGKYAGMKVKDARKAVVEDAEKAGLIIKQEPVPHRSPTCWRCHNAVEILEKKAWFMGVRAMTDKVVDATNNDVKWIPDFYKKRQINWARGLSWDWVISRQKVYGTPIPVWYCKSCDELATPTHESLPVDPYFDKAPVDKCSSCGHTEFVGESDTMDTWMDSSVTIAYHAGWPDNFDEKLYPATMQPNGADIIRTWDYYLMVRHLMLFGSAPYKELLINGLVQGKGGKKMSKSLGNYVTALDARDKHGVDALRQWVATGGAPGTDILFDLKLVTHGYKFQTKLWNATSFLSKFLEGFTPDYSKKYKLTLMDEWILSKLNHVMAQATADWDAYKFNTATDDVRNFFWHDFCDFYLEYVKDRVYNPSVHGDDSYDSARFVLHEVILRTLQLLAPVMPHLTEEIYQTYFKKSLGVKSIHLGSWPKVDKGKIIPRAEQRGEFAKDLISAVRKYKTSRNLPLNKEIPRLVIYASTEDDLMFARELSDDLRMILKVTALDVIEDTPHNDSVKVNDDLYVLVEM